jgi:putative sterol carrier protein
MRELSRRTTVAVVSPSKSRAAVVTDATSEFFRELERRGYEPLLRTASGSVRFDLEREDHHIDHWRVTVKAGEISLSHATRRADAVVRADRAVFERIVSGEANAMAALLRGELIADGDLELVMLMQRLLPGPPSAGRFSRRSTQGGGDGR